MNTDTPTTISEYNDKFIQLIKKFASGMSECYPDDPRITDTASKVMLVCESSFATDTLISEWYKYLQSPLSAKYSRSVERILREKNDETANTCTMYHAFVYGDMKAALDAPNPIEKCMDIKATLTDPTFDQESKDAMLKYIRALNDCVYGCKGQPPPYCPSRDELSADIKRHKSSSKPSNNSNGRLSNAFTSVLSTLASGADNGNPELIAALAAESEEESSRDWIAEWHREMSNQTPQGTTLYVAVSSDDFEALKHSTGYHLLGGLCIYDQVHHLDADRRTETREMVAHLNVLAQVHTSVPLQMRDRITEVAGQLATDILEGHRDITTIDLNQMGKDVLEGCNSEDLSSLADQIGSLLPVLSKGVPQDMMMGDPSAMLEMLKR